jgi:hypothetical protein
MNNIYIKTHIMNDKNDKKDLEQGLDNFLEGDIQNEECTSEECMIKTDKSLVERINKKIITEDGRELLM